MSSHSQPNAAGTGIPDPLHQAWSWVCRTGAERKGVYWEGAPDARQPLEAPLDAKTHSQASGRLKPSSLQPTLRTVHYESLHLRGISFLWPRALQESSDDDGLRILKFWGALPSDIAFCAPPSPRLQAAPNSPPKKPKAPPNLTDLQRLPRGLKELQLPCIDGTFLPLTNFFDLGVAGLR